MTKQVGVWMDHRGAVLIFTSANAERRVQMESGVEKHERVAGQSGEAPPEDDHRDRHFADRLDKYYDEVIRHLVASEAVFLFGPGEAKGEFQKRMATKGFGARIVAVESADKMTEPQIAAKVREYFRKRPVASKVGD
jgi:hypothetical protein